MWKNHLDVMSDRSKETSGPEQSRPRRRCWDVPASSHIQEQELAQLASIRRRLLPLQRTCEDIAANQSRNPRLANLSPTERVQITLPPILVKEACGTLIDYIRSIEGTARETNKDPRPAANKIIEFLEARSQPDTKDTNYIRDLAEDIKRLFTPRAQREVAQAPSLPYNTAPSYHSEEILTPSSFQRPSDTALQQTDSPESVRTINIRKLVNALVDSGDSGLSLPQHYNDLYREFNKTNGKPLNDTELVQAYDFLEEHRLRPSLDPRLIGNIRDRLRTSYFTADD